MKLLYRISADSIWLLHFFVVLLVLFGWMMPELWLLYMTVMAATLVSEYLWDYCILSKWEHDLRRKADPLVSYDFTYASFYTYRLTQGLIKPKFLNIAAKVFLWASLAINLWFVVF